MENTSGTHEFAYHHEKRFSGMYAEWANALNTGKSDLLPGGEDGMKVADIARRATDAAIMNRRTKRCTAEERPCFQATRSGIVKSCGIARGSRHRHTPRKRKTAGNWETMALRAHGGRTRESFSDNRNKVEQRLRTK